MREDTVRFGDRKSLVGIVTHAPESSRIQSRTGVILLNPGVVHRVGPGRIYVKIARTLADAGFEVLRFDFSGIGDSAARHDNLPFEKSAVSEVQEAMEFLQSTRKIETFILLGGCSGARISIKAACQDPRVICAIPINFPVTEDDDGNPDLINRRTAHYYWKFSIFRLRSWLKLLTGKADYTKIFRTLRFQANRRFGATLKISSESLQLADDLRLLVDRDVHVIFLYSASDPRLNELREAARDKLERILALGKIRLEVIPGADHTFSSHNDQQRLLQAILKQIGATYLSAESHQLFSKYVKNSPGGLASNRIRIHPALRA